MSGCNRLSLTLVVLGCSVAWSAPAFAQQAKYIGPEQTVYVHCTWMSGADRMVTQIEEIRWRDANHEHKGSYLGSLAWELEKRLGESSVKCEWAKSPQYGSYKPGKSYESVGGKRIPVVLRKVEPSWFFIEDLRENLKVSSLDAGTATPAHREPEKTATAKSVLKDATPAGPSAAEIAAKARQQREAEWQAKVAAHEAAVADYQRKLTEREAEIARQRKQHAAAVDAASREQAAYEAKMEAHRLELAEANRRQQAYFEAQRQHALCVNGNRAACDALKQPQAGKDEQASTDTDATMCVSGPVVAATPGMKGSLSATVINGCPTAVDVRICLNREGGWNCGVTWGLKPQARWSHSSFKSSGDIFWDARTSGSSKPLASPAGR